MRANTQAKAPIGRAERVARRPRGPAATTLVAAAATLSVHCGSSPSDRSAGAEACAPGMSVACVGAAGCGGYQVCRADGTGFDPCDCNGTGADAGNSTLDSARPFGEGGASDGNGNPNTAGPGHADGGDESATAAPTSPVEVSASPQSAIEVEVQLAAAPDGTIAIAWIAASSATAESWIAYRFSSNGGATFSPIARVSLPSGLQGSDPALTADAAGNFYLALLGVHVSAMAVDYTRVYVAKAEKGRTAFGPPAEVTNASATTLYDHPKILATASGKLVVAFSEPGSTTSTTAAGRVATSQDGQTWQLGTIVDDPSSGLFANLFWLCEGAGILYTTYLETTMTAGYIALRSSNDDGASWTTTSTVVSLSTEVPAGLDPGCVASGDDAWVAYATNRTPTMDPTNWLDSAQAIRLAHVANRGGTLDSTRVDAIDSAASTLGLLPVLVREPSGALDVVYLAGDSEGDSHGSMRYAQATGSRAAFGASVSVDGPLLFTMNRSMPTWLGDYLGAAYSGGRLLLAYPKNSTGRGHIFFRSVLLP